LKLDFGKVWVSRIQQDIPFITDGSRWDQQSDRLSATNPLISEATQRFIPRFVPLGGKSFRVKASNLKRVGNLAFD
jgi:hypothetical protein